MPKLRYKRDHAAEVVPATGAAPFVVEPGEVVEVDADTAESLLTQVDVWEKATEPKPKTEKKENG